MKIIMIIDLDCKNKKLYLTESSISFFVLLLCVFTIHEIVLLQTLLFFLITAISLPLRLKKHKTSLK